MASYNSVTLLGNIAREPETKEFGTGTKKASFVIAVSERGYKKKDGTEVKPQTEYINCETWGPQATLIEKYVHKGDLIFVVGKLKTDVYEKDGQKHYKTVVSISDMQFMPKGGGQQSASSNSQESNAGAVNNQPTPSAGVEEDTPLPF